MPQVVLAADPELLEPAGPWNVYSASDRCVLARDYGKGDDAVTMAFRPLPMSDLAEMRLVTNTKKAGFVDGTGVIMLLPGPIEVRGYARGSRPGAKLRRTTSMSLSQEAMKALPKASEITMAAPGERPVRVRPKRIAAALDALKRCNDAITATWGVDLAEQARVTTPAARKPNPYVMAEDYPAKAVRTTAEADSTAIWRIGTDGMVSNCKVIIGSDPLFDDALCKAIAKRARYTSPALNSDGKPVVLFQVTNVRWRMPNRDPAYLTEEIGILPGGDMPGMTSKLPTGYRSPW